MKKKEQGRSTLEIIGVLAVLVFLTLGGLQVYSAVQSSLMAEHLEKSVLEEATIKKHENSKSDDTDAHEVSHQGPYNTTITSQNGTVGTEQVLFWVTINDINVIAEQKVCQKLLDSKNITDQEWLGLKTILVNGQIVENCPAEIQTITYYFQKRKTVNLEDILLDNPDCQNPICPTHATCANGQITICDAGYKISSNGCECVKCTGRVRCDGVNEQECDEGTKPNANHTQCAPCKAGEKDELCCPNGAVVSNEKDCDCEGNPDCPSDFVCVEGKCTCQDQAPCPLCKDKSEKCWDEAQKQCIACSPSSFTTQDTCTQNDFQWCEAVEECKLKTDECPECDEHTDCANATPKCDTATQTCEACPDETPAWNGTTCVTCADNNSDTPVWDATGKTCVTCAEADSTKPNWDATSKTCVSCQRHYDVTGDGYQCPASTPYCLDGTCKTCTQVGAMTDVGPTVDLVKTLFGTPARDASFRGCYLCINDKTGNSQDTGCPSEYPICPTTSGKGYNVCCPEDTPKWSGTACVACPNNQKWNGEACVSCTADTDCSAGKYCNSNGSCANCAEGKKCRCTYCSNGSGSCQTAVQWCQWKYGTNFDSVVDNQCQNHTCSSSTLSSPWSCRYTVGSDCDIKYGGGTGDNAGWNCYQYKALSKTCSG